MAHAVMANGVNVLALAAVNATGSPLIGDTKHFWATPFEENAEFGGYGMPHPWPDNAKVALTKAGQRVAGANTTLAVVVTDAALNASQAKRLATAAHDGFARALYPVHTPADGDLAFAASTGERDIANEALLDLGILAGNTVARAIARGVFEALRDQANQAG
jgi:L-aminopeptidase/D-esterase-like protein